MGAETEANQGGGNRDNLLILGRFGSQKKYNDEERKLDLPVPCQTSKTDAHQNSTSLEQ